MGAKTPWGGGGGPARGGRFLAASAGVHGGLIGVAAWIGLGLQAGAPSGRLGGARVQAQVSVRLREPPPEPLEAVLPEEAVHAEREPAALPLPEHPPAEDPAAGVEEPPATPAAIPLARAPDFRRDLSPFRPLAPRASARVPDLPPEPPRPGEVAVEEPRPLPESRLEYPRAARRLGLEGVVTLRVEVGEDGRVRSVAVEVSSGHAILDEAAVSSVARWAFEPARQGGRALARTVLLPVRFTLRPDPE